MNKVDSIYIICRSFGLGTLFNYGSFSTDSEQYLTGLRLSNLSGRESGSTGTINQQSQGDSRSCLIYSLSQQIAQSLSGQILFEIGGKRCSIKSNAKR